MIFLVTSLFNDFLKYKIPISMSKLKNTTIWFNKPKGKSNNCTNSLNNRNTEDYKSKQ